MRKCIIIGGGLAGLSSGVYLSRAGINVTILEASPKLGGRSYSLKDNATGDIIDNGQHLLMGCYNYTLDFLRLIGTEHLLPFPKNLSVKFVNRNAEQSELTASAYFYPFNLLVAFLNFRAISFKERLSAAFFAGKILLYSDKELKRLTVLELLRKENQSDRTIKSFWEIIAAGALNADLDKVSAKLFTDILKQIFLTGGKSFLTLVPQTGLSELYCENALEFIRQRGGEICCSTKIEKLNFERNKIVSIASNKEIFENFDFVVSAVPPYALSKLTDNELEEELNLNKFQTSPILSAHLWLKENKFKESFYGLIESDVQWVFNHGSYISITISNAEKFINMDHDEIKNIMLCDLKKYFPFFSESSVSQIKIIKEKRATFVPSNEILNLRPGSNTKYKNFFLAGDWTDTALPATIEGAVKSGKTAAENILLFY